MTNPDTATSTPYTESSTQLTPALQPKRRSIFKRTMHVIRRGHLYLGLFLFPWAILYGITGFLFNHPTAFSDQPSANFGKDTYFGTSLENLPSLKEQAESVVAKLNESQKPTTPYKLVGEANWSGRDFAFATVKTPEHNINILIDVKNGGGTIRSTKIVEKKEPPKAPFAKGGLERKGVTPKGKMSEAGGRDGEGIKLDDPIHERIRAAIPTILEKNGFATGEVTVTSVPDIAFPIEANGEIWKASYNQMTGTVTGVPNDFKQESEMSLRRFLLRLHTTHGYPGETNSKWFWAVIVDVMAFVMCFWGFSGILMWWQLKATRKLGAFILLLSTVAATILGLGMYASLTGG